MARLPASTGSRAPSRILRWCIGGVSARLRAGAINETSEPLLPRRAVVQLRRMQRLRRDLGVNFSGAAVILDLVKRIEQLNAELIEMQRRFGE